MCAGHQSSTRTEELEAMDHTSESLTIHSCVEPQQIAVSVNGMAVKVVAIEPIAQLITPERAGALIQRRQLLA